MRYFFGFLLIHSVLINANPIPKIIQMDYIEDISGKLTISDISSNWNNNFKSCKLGTYFTIQNPKFHYWIRLRINEKLGSTNILHCESGRVSSITLYVPDLQHQYTEHYAGFDVPYATRDFFSDESVFEFIAHDTSQYIYLRCKAEFYTNFSANVRTKKKVLYPATLEIWYKGIFIGAFLIITLYNLAIFIINREFLYFFYALYAFSFLYFALIQWSHFNMFIPFTKLGLFSYTLPYSVSIICLIFYARLFLNTKKEEPKFDKILICLAYFKILIVALNFFYKDFFYPYNFRLMDDLSGNYADAICLGFCFLVGLKRYINGYKSARFFLIGMFVLSFSAFYKGYMEKTDHVFMFILGLLDAIVFSFALADRYRLLKSDVVAALSQSVEKLKENEVLKDKLNNQLETLVSERTVQIQQQAEEIRIMNEKLKEHNISLIHEVQDVAEARLLQKKMSYSEFSVFFPSDSYCRQYLSEMKWSVNKPYQCKKCSYEGFKLMGDFTHKCRRCNYLDSPLNNTLYHNLKFSLTKAFYITYVCCQDSDKISIEQAAQELDLRTATYWAFKQKVLELMTKAKSKRNQKLDWTHLIEYSINFF